MLTNILSYMLYYIVLYYTMLHYIMLCYNTLHYVMLFYVMLCYVMLHILYTSIASVKLFHDPLFSGNPAVNRSSNRRDRELRVVSL